MNEIELLEGRTQESSGSFEQTLSKAGHLIEQGNIDSALALLSTMEFEYVRSARLFSLMGELFLRRGDVQMGIRYKVLHEVLKGTFQIAMDEVKRQRRQGIVIDQPDSSSALPAEHGTVEDKAEDFIPVTAAMGHEFMRQGHYGRAQKIFAELAARNPQDLAVKQALEEARKKFHEKRIVGVLQSWLSNLEQMKTKQSAGA
ncbi:hypothetical protein [Desulfomonile tiedjei]|uniref:Tetratricopeptide repeat protein n=1 Tax=Desulfomonile tiedjei (strain ATCC 49306 / DSM 6799 / DCB-1) TaxID=706587 RepID=I4C9V7_DESTA|nr:hypothetical protein [Desulfomonile tiedjei]AFM26348.1 hypothetical protein Desti_3703 [Desulfomonile tiedjei DSM 6799]